MEKPKFKPGDRVRVNFGYGSASNLYRIIETGKSENTDEDGKTRYFYKLDGLNGYIQGYFPETDLIGEKEW